MKSKRPTNLLWGFVFVAISLALVLRALGNIPDGIFDVIVRAWPGLLVLAGLTIFLRHRVALGSFIALAISLAAIGGVITLAFSSRATEERTDYREVIAQPITDDITLLEVSIETLAADVEILRSLDPARGISGEFVGSTESQVTVTYTEDNGGRAVFRLTETQPNAFPMLEAVGRGKLRLELPADVALDVAFRGMDGDVTFNMSQLSLERLNINQRKGSALITLPEYAPRSPNVIDQPGNLIVQDGSITIFVPAAVAARFELNRGGSGLEPQFEARVYNYLVGDVLEAKDYEESSIKLRYSITAPRGRINIETSTG